MVNGHELKKRNILYHPKSDQYVTVSTIGIVSCLVKPATDEDDTREFDALFEELDGIAISSKLLKRSGFKEVNPGEDYDHSKGLSARLTENSFWIMDRTGTALSKRLFYLHQLQNIYEGLKLEPLKIKL